MVMNKIYKDDQVEIIQIGLKKSLFYVEGFLLLVILIVGSVTSILIISNSDFLGIEFYIGFLFGVGAFILLTLIFYSDLKSYFKFKKSKKAIITITIRVTNHLVKDTHNIIFKLNSQKIAIPIDTNDYELVINTNLRDYKCTNPFFFLVHIEKPLVLEFNSKKLKFYLSNAKQESGTVGNIPKSLLIYFKKLELPV